MPPGSMHPEDDSVSRLSKMKFRCYPGEVRLTCPAPRTQTKSMAHIYMRFDFARDEEKAQLARHKLEVWKQAFRLDKKLLYKFERSEETGAKAEAEAAKPERAKGKGKAKGSAKGEAEKSGTPATGNVHLLVRLGFSGHEKLSEHRWVERIPTEEPFLSSSPVTIKPEDAKFDEMERRFEDLE